MLYVLQLAWIARPALPALQVNWRINNVAKWGNFSSIGTREVQFGSLTAEDDEHDDLTGGGVMFTLKQHYSHYHAYGPV